MKKHQTWIGIALVGAILFFAYYLSNREGNISLFLFTGVALGYILTRSRFGFAGGVRRIYLTGDGSLSRALLIMFAISVIGAAGIHYGDAVSGAVPAFRAAEGQAIITGTGFVAKITAKFIIGAFIFGIGMILAGGCASGTLTDSGEGEIRAWITVFFFGLGGIVAHWANPNWSPILAENGLQVYLPDHFGYFGSVVISLVLLAIIYILVKKYEHIRKRNNTLYEEQYIQEPYKIYDNDKLDTGKLYHVFFGQKWSYLTGGVLIAMMFIFIMTSAKTSWGASGPYALWDLWLFDKLGISFTSPGLEGPIKGVEAGLMNNGVSIRNIGIILGSALAMLLARKFSFNFNFTLKDSFFYALGGTMMGFGAMTAGGCNIGGLYSGIANFSLSGWIFLVVMSIAGIIALKLFEGKVNIIPKRGVEK